MTGQLTIAWAASELLDCEATRRDRPPLTDQWPSLDLRQGYAIQDETLNRRLRRGERLTGVKLGLTSQAKQQAMGLSEPLVAWLTDAMALPAGPVIETSRFIHPRLEPELVLVLGEDLVGPGVRRADALAAVAVVRAGVELIDSRFQDFRFRAADVVADNASAGGYRLGEISLDLTGLDLASEAVTVAIDGETVDQASGAAILGHPGEALALAANQLAERGRRLQAGQIVLTGGMTAAYPLLAGRRLSFCFSNLGRIDLRGV